MCRSKNAGVAGYAEAFRPVQSDSQTSEWYSYFENDVLVICALKILKTDFVRKIYCSTVISKSQQKLALILNEC